MMYTLYLKAKVCEDNNGKRSKLMHKSPKRSKCELNNLAHGDFHVKTLTLSYTYNVSQVNVVKTTIVWRLHFIPQKAE